MATSGKSPFARCFGVVKGRKSGVTDPPPKSPGMAFTSVSGTKAGLAHKVEGQQQTPHEGEGRSQVPMPLIHIGMEWNSANLPLWKSWPNFAFLLSLPLHSRPFATTQREQVIQGKEEALLHPIHWRRLLLPKGGKR